MAEATGRTPTVVDTAAGVHDLVAALPAGESAAIGIWAEAPGGLPLHLAEDPRSGPAAHVGIALPDGTTFVIVTERVADLEALRHALDQPSCPYVVFHGAQAAMARLAPLGGPFVPARFGCTQVAAVLLAEGARPRRELPSLQQCAAKLLDVTFPEPGIRSPAPGDPATVSDVARRAATLLPLMRALMPKLRARELVATYQLECDVVPAVVTMEGTGFAVDGASFERIAAGWQRERDVTDDPERIARLDKLLSTYAYWPREYVRNNRIHCRLHPLAADSGRFSCTDPNLQQVPRADTAPGLRECFAAPEGKALVIADYAQIELRVAAHLAPCDALRQVFAEGRDPHRATAATITGRPEAEISDRERQLAKAVNFGFLFGMGPGRFRSYARDSYGVELDDREASRARDAFLRTFPGIAAWHRRVGSLGRQGAPVTVRTALGRRKRFSADKFSFNAALNIPVQGTAAEGFKLAMTRLHPLLRELGGAGVLVVHDEYIAEVPEDRADEARDLIEATMASAMAEVVPSVPIVVEAATCRTWGAKS